ncbi:BTB/POZ domain-containing protein 6-B-like [Orbicella faveolata]|uniref:BTB/POZ domain-containing protein 6-B-like n=1 Tax=Orbicella faveolata TaxID=48498 RepID=UPI0009E5F541|nr:BTB/POZ domain-containing protein 6-B-like [Orbicella faveolata]
MSVIEKNWQTTKPTIRERSKHMFNNDLFSDVKFVVRGGLNGESESKQVIPAHKFVLSISSPVFEAMFYGELAETTDSIELPDGEYDSLLELFRYMYSDEVILSGSNVMGLLYLAKKYMVPSLADKCMKYLQDNLDPSNVFSILPSAQKFEEKNLVDRCWKLISKQTEEALKSECFETIERSLLEAVVKHDNLTIEEIELFKTVDLWATKECERQGLAADGEAKRRILGEEIIKGIRFPIMDEKDFASVVLDSKILTTEEIIKEVFAFFKYYNSALNSPLEFLESVRSGFHDDSIHRCRRFSRLQSVRENGWNYGPGRADGIDFTVDKDIMLHGLCLFGSENNDYTVTLTIKQTGTKLPLASKTGTFPSKLLQYADGGYYGFEILFDFTVECKKNTRYEIEAVISGPKSWRGNDGISSVVCSGVTFTFTDNANSNNGTSTRTGQFPEVMFSMLPKPHKDLK